MRHQRLWSIVVSYGVAPIIRAALLCHTLNPVTLASREPHPVVAKAPHHGHCDEAQY
jgi:hypothetical protein